MCDSLVTAVAKILVEISGEDPAIDFYVKDFEGQAMEIIDFVKKHLEEDQSGENAHYCPPMA